jgi:hypothetical protein
MNVVAMWRLGAAGGGMMAALVMATVLLGVGVQRGVVGPPQFEVALGPLQLSGFVTQTPNCRRSSYAYQKSSLCSGASLYMTSDYFAVWMLHRSKRGTVTIERARRLVLIHLEER